MKEDFQPVRGTRDFLPEEKIVRQKIVDTLREIFETFGFSPLETPGLERWEILSKKYAGGDEILKETYRLKDQGGRELGLRYDLTVPLCRVIAANPELPKPFKRYQIGRVWRDGPVKKGRYREFWQCDIDTVGSNSMIADAELVKVIDVVAKKLNIKAEIKINNRKILNGILKYAGIDDDKMNDVILSIDKLEKIGVDGVEKELMEKGIDEDKIRSVMEILLTGGSNEEIINSLRKIEEAKEGLMEIEELFSYLNLMGVNNVRFVPSLARGLVYYTGTIFEAFFKDSEITSSFAAGGRYDDLIGKFLGSEKIPAVGVSFGLDVLTDYLSSKVEKKRTLTKVFVIPIGTLNESLKILKRLRDAGIKSDIDLMERGISKNLNYVNSQRIPYSLIIGEKELKENTVKLKDMKSGEEKLIKIEDLIEEMKNILKG